MISTKNILIYGLICLAACSTPKKETAEVADSTKTDSIANEETPTDTEGGSAFDIDPSLAAQDLTIFGKEGPVVYWITKLYRPDHQKRKSDTVNASYTIKSVDLFEDEYSNKDGGCSSRSILKVTREMPGEEYYDVHFLFEDADGNLSSEKVTFDGDIAQTTAYISLSTDYKLSDNCSVLAISSNSEGGDIETYKTKGISFFVAGEGAMKLVFELALEETKTEYRASPQDEEKYTSELRDFEILSKKTNGLYDIKVHTTSKKDGNVTGEKDTIFRFNGEKYAE